MRVIGLTFDAVRVRRNLEGFASTREEQVHAVRRWARQYGHEVIAVYAAERGPLERTYNALIAGSAKVVVLPADILADWIWLPESLSFRPYTGRVIAADTDKMVDIRARQVGAWARYREATGFDQRLSEKERERSRRSIELMKEGRRRKHEQGGYAYGAPPFGWVAVEGGLAPDPREQETRNRGIQLRDQGLSLRAICERLDAEGHRTRSGRSWSSGTLSRILDRPDPPAESIVDLNIAPWPRKRDGSRGGGRLKLFSGSRGDKHHGRRGASTLSTQRCWFSLISTCSGPARRSWLPYRRGYGGRFTWPAVRRPRVSLLCAPKRLAGRGAGPRPACRPAGPSWATRRTAAVADARADRTARLWWPGSGSCRECGRTH